MDLLPYVESRAIREHLAAIGHRFNSMEAAVLIQNNENLSPGERIQLWRQLLDHSEDMPLPVNDWFPKAMSLHEWLREDIRCWEIEQARFEKEEEGAAWLADGNLEFSSFSSCMAALKANGGYVQKVWRENGKEAQTIKVILSPGGVYSLIDADNTKLPTRSSVMGMHSFWIDVPTPFHKGDLLQGENGDLCILLDDERWHMTQLDRFVRKRDGCFLDMCVTVAILRENTKPRNGITPVDYPYLLLDYPDYRKPTAYSGKHTDRRAD